ncbi:MAG: haloacid dehalogenase-like hydrolase [Isosphaeraceae bacterium]
MNPWPRYETPPPIAFLDVDGTLLAETTTFLFTKILRRRGLIRRSFVLRAAYHGLQHKFGRLDYGRLIAFGLRSIASIPVTELEQIALENFEHHVKPRLYEGVVDHFDALRRSGTQLVLVSSSPGIVLDPLSRYLGCVETLTTPVLIEGGILVDIGDGPSATARGSCTGPAVMRKPEGFGWTRRPPMRIIGPIVPSSPRQGPRWWSTPANASDAWPKSEDGSWPGPHGPEGVASPTEPGPPGNPEADFPGTATARGVHVL